MVDELLPALKHYGLQAWKINGRTMSQEPTGYILPVLIISDVSQIENGPCLDVKSPVKFKRCGVISGFLYYIIALPPP